MRLLTRIALVLAAALLLLPAVSADRINLRSDDQTEREAVLAERASLPATLAGLDDDLPPICVRPAHPHFPVYLEDDGEPAFWVDDDDVPFDDPPPLDELPSSEGNDGTPVAAVPEPGTLALFGSGLIAIGIGVRQRLKRGA